MNEYPKELELIDKTRVTIRPVEPVDVEGLYKFFSKITRLDLLVYKDDVTKWENVEGWFAASNYGKAFQLIVLSKDKIVAKGSLHSEGLYWSHAAELKLIVDPNYRRKGLGSQLFNILLYEGLKRHFEKIIVRYISDNISFTKILNRYGFKPETVLSCYVKDELSSITKDLVIASYDIKNWERRFEFYSSIYGR
ncbi:MAG: N-acetyltransferase family protein [Candidatus Dadabacteria bacterium]|jgi:L-amino acid N-acyltransferase YncA